MSMVAEKYNNIINLRLFGCIGEHDAKSKLIPYVANCIQKNKNINLHQDAWFDFLYVEDIAPVIRFFIETASKHKTYNLCSGERVLVSSVAKEVRMLMDSEVEVKFNKSGLNFEYTGDNARLRAEIKNWKPLTIKESIKLTLRKEGHCL